MNFLGVYSTHGSVFATNLSLRTQTLMDTRQKASYVLKNLKTELARIFSLTESLEFSWFLLNQDSHPTPEIIYIYISISIDFAVARDSSKARTSQLLGSRTRGASAVIPSFQKSKTSSTLYQHLMGYIRRRPGAATSRPSCCFSTALFTSA